MNNRRLSKQLKKNGASNSEIKAMVKIAENLSSLQTKKLSDSTRDKIEAFAGIKRPVKTPYLRIASGMAGAMAVVALVFVGMAVTNDGRMTPNPQDGQTHSTEAEEIEMQVEQTKTELEELRQAEEVQPEVIEEAETKYEDALNRWQRWQEENEYDDDSWRNRRDVRGDSNNLDEEDNEESDYRRWWWNDDR